jgi:hypothetical protein
MHAIGLKTENPLAAGSVTNQTAFSTVFGQIPSSDESTKEVDNCLEAKVVSNALIENSVARKNIKAMTFNEALASLTTPQSETPVETIKQLVLRALIDHFHDGATPLELRTYIRDAYGREIDRTSMGPQLSRMRDEGVLIQPLGLLNEGKWRLSPRSTIHDDSRYYYENEPRSVKHPSSKK